MNKIIKNENTHAQKKKISITKSKKAQLLEVLNS